MTRNLNYPVRSVDSKVRHPDGVTMRVRILGESVIALEGHEYTPQAPYFFALLLRLSADPGHFFTRDELCGLLFPASPSTAAAMHSVRQLLYQAGRRGATISKRGDAVALAAHSLTVDINDLFHDQPHPA